MNCSANSQTVMAATRVAIVVVGDEILKGQVVDTNSHFLTSRLHAAGIRVVRISVVADDVAAIAEQVARDAQSCDYVITCGGIGPTHDDVTYEGVARALGVPLARSSNMAKAINKFMDCKNPGKMAQVPENASLLSTSASHFPVVRAGNVFILPGIPEFCEMGFSLVRDVLSKSGIQFYSQELRIRADEMAILPALNKTVDSFIDRVALGSYPYCTADGSWHTRVTLESTSVDDLCAARSSLVAGLAPELLDLSLTPDDAQRVLTLAKGSSPLAKLLANSIKVIEKAFEEYSPSQIVLSFNGGKDCTALLHLVWAVSTSHSAGPVQTLYVRCEDPFPEITIFIDDCVKRYGLEIDDVAGPIKPALEGLLKRKPHVKAVWMGTRRTDPYSQKLKTIQVCDPGWPQVMRVNPLLDWSYHDVWTFLRCLAVPCCPLYDQGYTSLGNRGNTAPNPALFDNETETYKPAYTLTNGDLERKGRM